ncbi:Lsr2 family protein [Nonomuraea sp. NPDC059023]|uniref:histone-like nucleoid-structuring protein Lsr2 n=1 Tax=unclassified Nonomuraea TaxID=2593643 RepID=UPI0036B38136
MAKQIVETFVDDIDGTTDAAGTVTFSYKGKSYEIDLSAAHDKAFDESMAEWIEFAREVKGESSARRGRRVAASGSSPALSREKSAEIRQWAKSHGLPVSERGRIASAVVEKYEAAH